jgi:hypothetical protein
MDTATHTSDSSVNDDIGAGVVQVNSSDSRNIYGQTTGHASDQMQIISNIRTEHAGETVGIAETLKSMRTIGSSLTIDPFGNGNCDSPGAGSGPGSAGSAAGHGHGADHAKLAGAGKRRDSFGAGHPPTQAHNPSAGAVGVASGDNAAAPNRRNSAATRPAPAPAAAAAVGAATGTNSEADEYSYSQLDTSGDFGTSHAQIARIPITIPFRRNSALLHLAFLCLAFTAAFAYLQFLTQANLSVLPSIPL